MVRSSPQNGSTTHYGQLVAPFIYTSRKRVPVNFFVLAQGSNGMAAEIFDPA